MKIRAYNPGTDYSDIKALYEDSNTYGGQYDDARDTKARLDNLIKTKPNSILVAEENNTIIGTVTIFEDSRSAWLYRFAVQKEREEEIVKNLWGKASSILKDLGHAQILVYAPTNDNDFEKRYSKIGFNKGSDYTAYWKDL